MKNIFKILRISKPLHKLLGLIIFLVVISSFLAIVPSILSKQIVDQVEVSIKSGNGDAQRVIILLFILFFSGFINTLLTSLAGRLGDHFSGKLRKFLTEKFFSKVLTLPQEYFDTELSGKIVNQLNRGIASIQTFMNVFTNFIFPSLLQTLFILIFLAVYSLPIAGFVLILFPIYIAISYYSSKKWGQKEVLKNKIEDKNRGRISEVILNMKLVKSFLGEKKEYLEVSNNLKQINEIYRKQSNIFHIFDFTRNTSLEVILLIVNAIIFISTFNGVFSIGVMVLLLQLVAQARFPLFGMSFILGQIQTGETGSMEYFQLLDLKSAEDYDNREKVVKLKNPSLEFNNVSFKYKESDIILKNITFKLNPNEKVALVGHSGAGKSTIVNLILKFYDATEGDVLIEGRKYSDLTHQYIRNNIALVFQENELFSASIKDNVAYGYTSDEDEKVIEEKVINALKVANAYDFVMKLKNGLNSEVGERGVRLSGGQKQRIQIARAVMKDAPILILDEATSSLDSKSEHEVQEALENLMKGKLTIIIAHRFSTIQNVDRIIVVENGQISDQGTPQSLAKKEGLYSELLKYQIEGNNKLLAKFELF